MLPITTLCPDVSWNRCIQKCGDLESLALCDANLWKAVCYTMRLSLEYGANPNGGEALKYARKYSDGDAEIIAQLLIWWVSPSSLSRAL